MVHHTNWCGPCCNLKMSEDYKVYRLLQILSSSHHAFSNIHGPFFPYSSSTEERCWHEAPFPIGSLKRILEVIVWCNTETSVRDPPASLLPRVFWKYMERTPWGIKLSTFSSSFTLYHPVLKLLFKKGELLTIIFAYYSILILSNQF